MSTFKKFCHYHKQLWKFYTAYCAAQHGFTTCNSLPSYTTDCYVHPKAMALPSLRVWI